MSIIKVLIVEDEIPAQDLLVRTLKIVEPSIEIAGKADSIQTAVEWLKFNTADLIFMDIHLNDGLSFSIFEQVEIHTPVIFTTAYDAYAIKAFKVSSIDYLLKPIDEDDLRTAINKYKSITNSKLILNISDLKKTLSLSEKTYQQRFIVHRGEKLLSVTVDQIAYFEGEDRYVYLVTKDAKRFIIDYKLAEVEKVLDPKSFYRLNRSFISRFEAIDGMINLSKSRVKVSLNPPAKRDVIVSSENNQDFKRWLNS
jgi:DNA-binding LytR/AlgR family response regulator